MKICPQCQTKNEMVDANCKDCGYSFFQTRSEAIPLPEAKGLGVLPVLHICLWVAAAGFIGLLGFGMFANSANNPVATFAALLLVTYCFTHAASEVLKTLMRK